MRAVRGPSQAAGNPEIEMKAKLFKQATTTAFPPTVTNAYVAEALARQAASRPAKTPPKPMPVTPTLPKVPKRHRQRRRAGGGK
jgi:hypothetical protein